MFSRVTQMIVFGDSNSDTGRRFSADSSYDFPLIGPFPWEKLFDNSNPDVSAESSLASGFPPAKKHDDYV